MLVNHRAGLDETRPHNCLIARPHSPSSIYIYGLGQSWSIGLGSTSTISSVTTKFSPGIPPPSQAGELYLWSGLTNDTGNVIEFFSIESWGDQSWCGGSAGQWCLRSAVFRQYKGDIYGDHFAPVNPTDEVTLKWQRTADKTGWTISASIAGTPVSTLTSAAGDMTIFGITTECDDYGSETVSAQTYGNTIIELETADPIWGATAASGSGLWGDSTCIGTVGQTTASAVTSSQGGKVWTIESIVIPAST